MTFTLVHSFTRMLPIPFFLAFTLNVSNFLDTPAHNRFFVSCVTPRPVFTMNFHYVPHS